MEPVDGYACFALVVLEFRNTFNKGETHDQPEETRCRILLAVCTYGYGRWRRITVTILSGARPG